MGGQPSVLDGEGSYGYDERLMTEDLKKYLMQLMSMVEGLYAIVITDRDGVPLIKVANEFAPEIALRANFLSTFGFTLEQAGKLGLSQNKSIVTMYNGYQVVQLNKLPLLVTMIANSDAKTGVLLSLDREIEDVLKDLSSIIAT